MASSLSQLIAELKAGPVVPLPAGEAWEEMIKRTSGTGRVHEVNEETYEWFLEVLPPREARWMAEGGCVGEFPHEIIGDQRLPVCVVRDECLDMLLQEISSDCHLRILVHLRVAVRCAPVIRIMAAPPL